MDGWSLVTEWLTNFPVSDKIVIINWYLWLSENETIEKQNISHPKDDDWTSVIRMGSVAYHNGMMTD